MTILWGWATPAIQVNDRKALPMAALSAPCCTTFAQMQIPF